MKESSIGQQEMSITMIEAKADDRGKTVKSSIETLFTKGKIKGSSRFHSALDRKGSLTIRASIAIDN